jgi:hypothetical protein
LKDFVECSLNSEPLFDDRHQDVYGNGNLDLSFHGVLGRTIERFDSKILFDPFEEDLDLPSAFEEQSNRQCR